ncbi:MAG: hypothetical protein K2G37_04575 [Clostridia bacterium]|nr:hypothetical protein [Clostridia bacterium]MDE7328642.1 hypothetical protein [Clostridia bacterium]
MKRLLSILLIILIVASVACLTLVALVGCSRSSYSSLAQVSEYKDLKNGCDRIEVKVNETINCLILHNFYFSVQDKDDINEIVNLLLNTRLDREDLLPPPGASGGYTLTVYQGEKTFTVSTTGVYIKDKRYVFSTNELFNKIKSLADSKGASDERYGIICKIIDTLDISGSFDMSSANLDANGVLSAIESDFSGFNYLFLYSSDGEAFELKESLESVLNLDFVEGQILLFHYICKLDDGSYFISDPSTVTYSNDLDKTDILAGALPRDLLKDLTDTLSSAFADIFGPLFEAFLT